MPMTAPSATLGSPVPDFSLPATNGDIVSLAMFEESPALLVAFICNHCPFVRHVESALGLLAADYLDRGVASVGISSNDVVSHPEDDVAHMRAQADRAGFGFPYLYDETQAVARAFGAACTPDFFLYDRERTLVYRGEFDASRPSNGLPVDGASLRVALDLVLGGRRVPEPQRPSVGCSIKWRNA